MTPGRFTCKSLNVSIRDSVEESLIVGMKRDSIRKGSTNREICNFSGRLRIVTAMSLTVDSFSSSPDKKFFERLDDRFDDAADRFAEQFL